MSVQSAFIMNQPAIFRYDLSNDVVEKIAEFAKLHKDDERRAYKEAWKTWCQEHEEMISEETRRLKDSGYNGNVDDKMYTACRYYFRKKSNAQAQETETTTNENVAEERKEPDAVKRGYVKLQSNTLECIDNHIKGCVNNNDFTPANGYQAFANAHASVFRDEIEHLKDYGMKELEVREKLKKTYKNRYYKISRS